MISFYFSASPVLNGLVLAGGKSTRMGTAKEQICWHGKQQQYAVADLLAKFCSDVLISCRPDQREMVNTDYNTLSDAFPEMGPMGGILSAFGFRKEAAWLVVACDLPLLDEETLGFLIQSRNPEKTATAYESPADGNPEPLAAIWEPGSFPLLQQFSETESLSPRKFLMNADILMLKPRNPQVLLNVNTPEAAAQVHQIINSRK